LPGNVLAQVFHCNYSFTEVLFQGSLKNINTFFTQISNFGNPPFSQVTCALS